MLPAREDAIVVGRSLPCGVRVTGQSGDPPPGLAPGSREAGVTGAGNGPRTPASKPVLGG